MKTKGRVLFSKPCTRKHYYDAIPSTDDGPPVDLVVQGWLPRATEHRCIVKMQDEVLAALAPDARRIFLELEELRNTLAAEREEAYFDLGVGHGIDRERRRCFRRFGRSHDALVALGEALAEHLAFSEEFVARARKTR